MITLKNLTAKNFMSIGNQVQSVNFETDNLTLIIGENLDQGGDSSGVKNGVGKCCCINTKIKIRNSLTGEIRELTFGELYNDAIKTRSGN